jgi:hypothetical protein
MSEHQRVMSAETQAIPESASPFPWWLTASVILGALLMATGAAIAMVHPALLVSPGAEINQAAQVYAGYLVSRNLVLASMLLFMLAIRARHILSALMVLTAFIQLLDAGMDIFEKRWPIVPTVLIYSAVFFFGAARLSGHMFWNVDAWRNIGQPQ